MANKHKKGYLTSYVIREMQIKTAIKYYHIPIGIAKNLEYGQHQMLSRIRSNRNSHSMLVGMLRGTATFEDSLKVVIYTFKHTLIWPSNPFLSCLPKWIESISSHRNLYINVYRNCIHHYQKLEGNKMHFNCEWWTNWYSHSIEYNSAIKKNELLTYATTWWILNLVC